MEMFLPSSILDIAFGHWWKTKYVMKTYNNNSKLCLWFKMFINYYYGDAVEDFYDSTSVY
jgi:hypothetical protein